MADAIDYFFQFPDKGTAQRDLVVGPLMAAQPTLEAILWQGSINSVDALFGGNYCVIVRQAGLNPALVNYSQTLLINDVTLRNEQLPSVLLAWNDCLPIPGLLIIVNAFSPYAVTGSLQLAAGATIISPYVTEAYDPYVTEDGLNIYVTE